MSTPTTLPPAPAALDAHPSADASPAAQVPPANASATAPQQAATPTRPNYRKSPRRRVLKDGKLIFGKGHSVVDCTIDNMSDGGAHVRVTSSSGMPEEFYLVETTRAVIHRASVAWRTTNGMGLRLLGPLEDVAAREAFLRKFKR